MFPPIRQVARLFRTLVSDIRPDPPTRSAGRRPRKTIGQLGIWRGGHPEGSRRPLLPLSGARTMACRHADPPLARCPGQTFRRKRGTWWSRLVRITGPPILTTFVDPEGNTIDGGSPRPRGSGGLEGAVRRVSSLSPVLRRQSSPPAACRRTPRAMGLP